MLSNLYIENYALIDRLNIDFKPKFSVITGETGAGKSILLGALGLILGKRADTNSLKNKSKKCIVEGTFYISNYNLSPFFKKHDLDYEKTTSVRREINVSGKSRAFINDTPVNLNQLKELSESLVDVHSQHETLLLNNTDFKFSILDSFAGNSKLIADYQKKYLELIALENELHQLIENQKKIELDADYYQFQLNELIEANIQINEQEELESAQKKINHSEEIKEKLFSVFNTLSGENQSVIEAIRIAVFELESIKDYGEELSILRDRLESSLIEISDISSEIDNIQNNINLDADQLQIINDRLDVIYRLQHKHHVNSNEELLKIQENLELKLSDNTSLKNKIDELSKQVKELKDFCFQLATKIADKRVKKAPELSNMILKMLSELKMPDCKLKIELENQNQLNKLGINKVNFYFSANKGTEMQEMSKIASGGELSRLMLCIKSIISEYKVLPTIIFDEIDTGVSGEVADKMGKMLKTMGNKMQVISITHLPQIASKGNYHYFVFKENSSKTTGSSIRELTAQERILEIAKMLSGEKTTDAAIENAKELLEYNT